MTFLTLNNSARNGTLRDRDRITTQTLYLLLALGLLPFLAMGLRLMALTAMGPEALILAGDWLNQQLTLHWVSMADRDVALYILTLPVAALLITLTRLTLGVRVLGFRSILIAIGIQEIGLVPCLLLILLIAGTVIVIRPGMRRSGFPLYARVAVVLCIIAFIMLMGLFAGVWLDSVTLWSMAFFPVVILAMLAESVAATVARDGLGTAIWRTTSTILLALVIAGLNQLVPLRELLLFCPELVLVPLVLIVFVSEFLDLRLFEGFVPFAGRAEASVTKPRVVFVRNRFPEAPPRRIEGAIPKRYRRASLQSTIDQLRERGYAVDVLEADATLPERLRSLANGAFGPQGGGICVLNCSGGIQGKNRLAQVPTVCEILGIPHTGPDPAAPVLYGDRLQQLAHLRAAGLHCTEPMSHQDARQALTQGQQSLRVRPRIHGDQGTQRVTTLKQLDAALKRAQRRNIAVVIEPVPKAEAITVVLLNPNAPERDNELPLLRRCSGTQPFRSCRTLSHTHRRHVVDYAGRAARVLECRGPTRVDLYCSESGVVTISRVLPTEPLDKRSAVGVAAKLAGISLGDIADAAIQAEQIGDVQSNRSTQSVHPKKPVTDQRVTYRRIFQWTNSNSSAVL